MNIGSILQGLGTLAALGFVGMLFLMFTRTSRNQNASGLRTAAIGLLIAAIALTTVGSGLVFLPADQYAVVRSVFQPNGYRPTALGPGLHWIIPFVESVPPEYTYSIAIQTYTMSSTASEGAVQGDDSIQARTKDGQQVNIDASVIYAIDPTQLISLNKNLQHRYEEQIVRPVARAAIRDAVSQYGVEEIVSTKRSELEQTVSDRIKKDLADKNILMTDFLLRNIRFSDDYAKAVEQKQIAEQQALQAKFVVEQKKQEAEQARQTAQGTADAVVIAAKGAADARLLQAQAEAKANELLAQSITPELMQYQYILKLSPGVQTIFIPSGNQFILPLPNTANTPATAPSTTP